MDKNNAAVPLNASHLDGLVGSTIKKMHVERAGPMVTLTMDTSHGHFVLITTVIDPVNGFVTERRPTATTRHPFHVNTNCSITTRNSN